jgi:hypothetical protein
MLAGVRFDGIASPPFLVLSGKTLQIDPGNSKLARVPSDWSFAWTKTGSMVSSAAGSTNEQSPTFNTMAMWASHNVQSARKTPGVPAKPYLLIDIIDQASCHFDVKANKILKDAGHILVGAPPNTSHYLQVMDDCALNGSMQIARRKEFAKLVKEDGQITRENVLPAIHAAFVPSYSSPNIHSALRKVGFSLFTSKSGTKMIDLSDDAIEHAINVHSQTYTCNFSDQSDVLKHNTLRAERASASIEAAAQRHGVHSTTWLTPAGLNTVMRIADREKLCAKKGKVNVERIRVADVLTSIERMHQAGTPLQGCTIINCNAVNEIIKTKRQARLEKQERLAQNRTVAQLRKSISNAHDRVRALEQHQVPVANWTKAELRAAIARENGSTERCASSMSVEALRDFLKAIRAGPRPEQNAQHVGPRPEQNAQHAPPPIDHKGQQHVVPDQANAQVPKRARPETCSKQVSKKRRATGTAQTRKRSHASHSRPLRRASQGVAAAVRALGARR